MKLRITLEGTFNEISEQAVELHALLQAAIHKKGRVLETLAELDGSEDEICKVLDDIAKLQRIFMSYKYSVCYDDDDKWVTDSPFIPRMLVREVDNS